MCFSCSNAFTLKTQGTDAGQQHIGCGDDEDDDGDGL